MSQQYTILFDLDGTLVDTAPDLMRAHNHVMKKFGYPTKSTDEIRNLVGQGAGAMLGRSIWGQAKKEFGKVQDKKIKEEMVKDFVEFYGKNIVNESTLINGVKAGSWDVEGMTQAEVNEMVQRNVDHLEVILEYAPVDSDDDTPDVKGSSDDKSSYTKAITDGKAYIAAN